MMVPDVPPMTFGGLMEHQSSEWSTDLQPEFDGCVGSLKLSGCRCIKKKQEI